MDRCCLAGNEEPYHWVKLGNIIESLYNKSTNTACPIIRHRMVSNNCQSSLKLYIVSMSDIFLEQTKTHALDGFIGTITVGGRGNQIAGNNDLIAGSKDKLTYLTSRIDLPTHICRIETMIENRNDIWLPPGKGKHCTGDNSGWEVKLMLDETKSCHILFPLKMFVPRQRVATHMSMYIDSNDGRYELEGMLPFNTTTHRL